MPEGLTAAEIAITMAVMLAGAAVFSTVGFGIGISATPLLLLVLEPQTAVVVINTSALLLFLLVIWHTHDFLVARDVAPMATAGMVGVPVGVAVLALASATVLRVSIATVIIALTAAMALKVASPLGRDSGSSVIAGFLASSFINATGIGGPIIALNLVARGWTSSQIRGALSAFFLLTGLAGVAGYAFAGLFTAERLVLIGAAAPSVALGSFVARTLTSRLSETAFRRAVVTVIFATSALVLARELVEVFGR